MRVNIFVAGNILGGYLAEQKQTFVSSPSQSGFQGKVLNALGKNRWPQLLICHEQFAMMEVADSSSKGEARCSEHTFDRYPTDCDGSSTDIRGRKFFRSNVHYGISFATAC